MSAETPQKSPKISQAKGPPTKEARVEQRLDVVGHRIDATLAVILGNRTMGFVVPVKDFSRTGIGVFSPIKVETGNLVRISVDGAAIIPLEGRVVWCGSSAFDQSAAPSHPFRVGIEYQANDDASREAQLSLYRHLAKIVGAQVT